MSDDAPPPEAGAEAEAEPPATRTATEVFRDLIVSLDPEQSQAFSLYVDGVTAQALDNAGVFIAQHQADTARLTAYAAILGELRQAYGGENGRAMDAISVIVEDTIRIVLDLPSGVAGDDDPAPLDDAGLDA